MPKTTTSKRHRTKAKAGKTPQKAKTPAAGKSPAPAVRKLASGQAAPALIAKAKALEATCQLEAMTPEQPVEAIAEHKRKRDELVRFNLFGQFDPQPISGRQRHLFDDGQTVSMLAPWPEKPATVSKTWPRPWAKSTPADARIARQYKAEGTPADLF
jgi:hypothetical protein